jgi:hypothetical protein
MGNARSPWRASRWPSCSGRAGLAGARSYGPLGRIIASPIYHGISHSNRHSAARAHRDANFAGFLTIRDRLLGTTAERGDEPPSFGVHEGWGANTLFYGATATVRGLYALARRPAGTAPAGS